MKIDDSNREIVSKKWFELSLAGYSPVILTNIGGDIYEIFPDVHEAVVCWPWLFAPSGVPSGTPMRFQYSSAETAINNLTNILDKEVAYEAVNNFYGSPDEVIREYIDHGPSKTGVSNNTRRFLWMD